MIDRLQRTLSLLITRGPPSPLANLALQDLERVCRLMKSAAKVQPFCANALVLIISTSNFFLSAKFLF